MILPTILVAVQSISHNLSPNTYQFQLNWMALASQHQMLAKLEQSLSAAHSEEQLLIGNQPISMSAISKLLIRPVCKLQILLARMHQDAWGQDHTILTFRV